ncbi:MAG: hypothetical protein QOE20_1588 [Mycobacterium sp.]|nr:hypothetical protein [Mycobacterium sp.]
MSVANGRGGWAGVVVSPVILVTGSETAFESIIPSVHGGNFNVGMSFLTDTAGRFADRQASHQWDGEVVARQL